MERKFEEIFANEFSRIIASSVETLKKVMINIENFTSYVNRNLGSIIRKLQLIEGFQSSELSTAVLDTTRRFFSIVKVEKLGGTHIYIARMEPPVVPHFFLFIAYLHKLTGLIPFALMRTEPVYSLLAPLVKGSKLTATLAQAYAGIVSMERYLLGEVVILPFQTEVLNLPVTSEKLYLTPLGYSPAPLKHGFNVEVDVGDVPPISSDLKKKLNFTSLKNITESIAKVIA